MFYQDKTLGNFIIIIVLSSFFSFNVVAVAIFLGFWVFSYNTSHAGLLTLKVENFP